MGVVFPPPSQRMLTRAGLWTAPRALSRSFCTATNKETVGFIGLGNMGLSMARNLIKNGFPVVGYDVSADNLRKLEADGAQIASSPKEVAEHARRIVSMVPASAHVQDVYCGADGVLQATQAGDFFIESSTIDPHVAKLVSGLAREVGANMIDAPVSGGVTGAANGTLTFMVGGEEEVLERARPLLEAMGKKITHCGPNGAGQIIKLCNNLSLAIQMIGVSEAMNLGTKLGMDPKLMADIFNSSTSRCWSSDTYNPVPGVMEGVPSSRGYEGGFGVDLISKDLSLALTAAQSVKAPVPLGSAALQLYNLMSTHGLGGKDFGVPYAFFGSKDVKK